MKTNNTDIEEAVGTLEHLYLRVAKTKEERIEAIRQLATYVPNKKAVGILEHLILTQAKSPEELMEIFRALGNK